MKGQVKKTLSKVPVLYKTAKLAKGLLIDYPKWLLFKIAKNWVILNRISLHIRPWLWKVTGVHIKGRVLISYDVYYDVNSAKYITIENGAIISPRVSLLCHRRDLSNYRVDDNINDFPYVFGEVVLKKGCQLGIGSIIMPGVTIGEGAVIGSGAVVTKDIPDWCIAVGVPAKVVKQIARRNENEK